MANNLKRNIEKGEEVIVARQYLVGDIDSIFICEDGFGMASFTSGNAIMGRWKVGGEKDRIEGWMIDEVATKNYQKELRNDTERTGTENTIPGSQK